MKKIILLAIFCTSLLAHADTHPNLSRCERWLQSYLRATADVWSWWAYDLNFPIWRFNLKHETYNALALRANDWARIRQKIPSDTTSETQQVRTLYRELKLYATDGTLLTLQSGDQIELDSAGLVANFGRNSGTSIPD